MGMSEWWRDKRRDFALYPKDENGDVLWRMARSGDDLTKSRKMDFSFIFERKDLAQKFCDQITYQGFQASLSYLEEEQSWDAECSIDLVPTHARVTSVERSLSEIAETLGGKADGWGSFVQ
jgi:hypothetical protein